MQGHEVVVLLHAKLVNAGQKVRRVAGTLIDITERKRRESDLERLAFEDPLTGLANRRALDEHATKCLALAERRGSFVGVAYLDVDRFKAINDRLGHSAGDAVLVEVSRRLEAAARRMIGELESTPVELENTRVTIRAGAGISVYPEDGSCLADLVQAADQAMYRTKERAGDSDVDGEDGVRPAAVATARNRMPLTG